jgi:hypothetical protein
VSSTTNGTGRIAGSGTSQPATRWLHQLASISSSGTAAGQPAAAARRTGVAFHTSVAMITANDQRSPSQAGR